MRLKKSIFEKIKYGDAMVLAITFYLGIKLEDEEELSRDAATFSRFSFIDMAPVNNDSKNDLVEAMLECREESE